jgi:hypothetical protein
VIEILFIVQRTPIRQFSRPVRNKKPLGEIQNLDDDSSANLSAVAMKPPKNVPKKKTRAKIAEVSFIVCAISHYRIVLSNPLSGCSYILELKRCSSLASHFKNVRELLQFSFINGTVLSRPVDGIVCIETRHR